MDTQDEVNAASAVASVKDAVEEKFDEILTIDQKIMTKLQNLTVEVRAHYAKPRKFTGIGKF